MHQKLWKCHIFVGVSSSGMGMFVKKIQGTNRVAQKWGSSSPPSPCEGITFRGSAYFLNATQNNFLIGYKKKATIKKFQWSPGFVASPLATRLLVLECSGSYKATRKNLEHLGTLISIVYQISVEELCSAYRFLAQFHLNKKNLDEAEKYAHKCCEHHEVRLIVSFAVKIDIVLYISFVHSEGNVFVV